uniref:MbtH-like protein n=1 Tax=Streptomyces verticillus TaxID=29309 RepID=Q9FB14_9ACTN|nr:MbtH-like protein [Streptomyces verticillus]
MTTTPRTAAEPTYHVVVNDEEQYSIWLAEQEIPAGWRATGTSGTQEECLRHIDEVWTDMRPRSLREAMAAAEHAEPAPAPAPAEEEPSLVDRLCAGDQPVESVLRPERTAAALREAVDRGYVFVRFAATRGGTELGVAVDPAATTMDGTELRLTGTLTLDFEPVRCHARVDVTTFTGEGRLERVSGT